MVERRDDGGDVGPLILQIGCRRERIVDRRAVTAIDQLLTVIEEEGAV